MNSTVRSYLIELARLPSEKTIKDRELSEACGLKLENKDPAFAVEEMSRILEEIARYEVSQGRPILSSIVVTQGGNYIREIYFRIAEEMKLPGWNLMKNDMTMEMKARQAVYRFWRDDTNYLNFK